MSNLRKHTRLDAPPGNFLEIRCPEIASEAILEQWGNVLSGASMDLCSSEMSPETRFDHHSNSTSSLVNSTGNSYLVTF